MSKKLENQEKNIIKICRMTSNCQCELCDPKTANLLKDLKIDPDPPTILCKFIEYWRGQYTFCCCAVHGRGGQSPPCLKIQLHGICYCPRCCYCIHLPRKDPLRCSSCKSKSFRYFVCKHQRGESGNYGRCNIWKVMTSKDPWEMITIEQPAKPSNPPT